MDKAPIKPYRRRDMERENLHGRDTICSTIRDVYLMTENEKIKMAARIAMRQSKSLYNELRAYAEKYNDKKWISPTRVYIPDTEEQ